jgi:hypothetical protein
MTANQAAVAWLFVWVSALRITMPDEETTPGNALF